MVRRLYPRGGLSENQGDILELDAYTRMKEDFTGTIDWLRFDSLATGSATAPYREKKKKYYKDALELNAVVVKDPSPKVLTDLGIEERVDLIATVMDIQVKEKAGETASISTKDLIEYKSIQYNINRLIGSGDMVYDKHMLVQILAIKVPGAI